MKQTEMISAFSYLGLVLKRYLIASENSSKITVTEDEFNPLESALAKAEANNPWFTRSHLRFMLETISSMLMKEKLEAWCSAYPSPDRAGFISRTVGIVMAGNIPLVGFHDLLCVLFSGHKALVKLSSEDSFLLPAIVEIIQCNEHNINKYINITFDRFTGFDAIIATGSNNTNRYFEYYFGNVPHILRKNRNGIGILTGREKDSDLEALADDIFLYFGKGCRNISKLYVPVDFQIDRLMKPFSGYLHFMDHNKYRNNLDYQRVVLQMNSIGFVDLGAVLLKEDHALPSPIALLHFERYEDIGEVREQIQLLDDSVQCIVCVDKAGAGWISPGQAQRTGLSDYADGIDTMKFLINL